MPKRTLLDTLRYRPGDVAYCVRLVPSRRHRGHPEPWMVQEVNNHPKVLYDRGVLLAGFRTQALPRLGAEDFQAILSLLGGRLRVVDFPVAEFRRSPDTGEVTYGDAAGNSMPEPYLFDSEVAARRELQRLKRLVLRWCRDEL